MANFLKLVQYLRVMPEPTHVEHLSMLHSVCWLSQMLDYSLDPLQVPVSQNVIYGFRNKLDCLSINFRLRWKGLPRPNTLAYYGNRKLRPQ
jgi:hypothetical protein